LSHSFFCYAFINFTNNASLQENVILFSGSLALGHAVVSALPLLALKNSPHHVSRVLDFKYHMITLSNIVTQGITLIGVSSGYQSVVTMPPSLSGKLLIIIFSDVSLLFVVGVMTYVRERTLEDVRHVDVPRIVEILGNEPRNENDDIRINVPQVPGATYQPNETEQNELNV